MKNTDQPATIPAVATSQLSWIFALLGAIAATIVAAVFVIGGLIDWSERNVTARTLWGVLAMTVSLLAPMYTTWLVMQRATFAMQSPRRRWLTAIGVPIVLIVTPIGLAILGHYTRGPIVIP